MREIKFRAKRIDNGEWVHGDLINSHCDMETYIYQEQCIDNSTIFLIEVIPETIGQFTGLPDKNGVEIYEGDVVKATNTENVGEIKYISEHSAFVVYSKDENGAYYEYMNQGLTQQYFEVIGNIHDNPELLEEKQ